MVDGLELMLCSDNITHISIVQAATMKEASEEEQKDIITRYQNCVKRHYKVTMKEYFYDVLCRDILHNAGSKEERIEHSMLVLKWNKM